jgi:hypothetical protein
MKASAVAARGPRLYFHYTLAFALKLSKIAADILFTGSLALADHRPHFVKSSDVLSQSLVGTSSAFHLPN